MSVSAQRISEMVERFEKIEAQLVRARAADEIARLSKEHAHLGPIAATAREVALARRDLDEARILSTTGDPEMAALAREEMSHIGERLQRLEEALHKALLPGDPDDDAGVVLEVRAGTGGEEAALFAADLFAMYGRYAARRGWTFNTVSQSPSDAGGQKEIIANVEGKGVYGRWKYESGVHRVQRIPATESGGRIHTSAATVAVLPLPPDEAEISIRPADIRVDTMRASGAGGQHVNKTDSAVRITHLPSGIVVISSEKSQHYNRAQALARLKAQLYERARRQQQDERAAERRNQLGSGDRSERIRTYNFPQGRVTDHRIGLNIRKLEQILSGDALDDVIEPLLTEDRTGRLAALDSDT